MEVCFFFFVLFCFVFLNLFGSPHTSPKISLFLAKLGDNGTKVILSEINTSKNPPKSVRFEGGENNKGEENQRGLEG